MQEEQKKLLCIVKKIKEKNLKINSKQVNDWIEKHLERFSYSGFHYLRGSSWTKSYIQKKISIWIKRDFLTELKKIDNLEKANNNWLSTAKELKFNKKEILLVKTIKQMTYCINLFDEVWNFLGFKSQDFLNEIAKRLKISYKELIEMDVYEVIDFLKHNKQVDKKFRDILKQRHKDSVYLVIENKITILIGKDLEDYYKTEAKKEIKGKDVKELKGQTASLGKVVGRVALVFSVNDLGKVKKRHILVAKATVPSFVPAMERAAAFITEVGGLLSHAAIISRELSKPCIVGIEGVTDILKDNDLVEVDANNGIVRKIR